MRDYQTHFIQEIKDGEGVILALPMGAGKTATVLTAIDDLLEDEEISKVLVVAPKNVAAATWPDEIDEWQHLKHLTWTLLRVERDDDEVVAVFEEEKAFARDVIGLDAKKAHAFANRRATAFKEWLRQGKALEDTEIHFINKEALPWLWEFFGKGKEWPYDMLVVDEASMFKNGKMRTAKKGITRFAVACKSRKYHKKVVELTGTPAPKGLINLWGLARVADGGERLGTSKWEYERRYFDKDYMGWNLEPKSWAEEKIMEKLGDIMFSLTEEDCVDLPPRFDVPVKVKLPKKVMQEYREFEKTLYSELYDVEAVNSGVLTGKLLQFANGSMYNEDRDDVWIHDEKLEALEALIEEANGAPVLVGYSFKFDMQRILKRYPKATVFGRNGDVRKQKADWNAGRIDLMISHPASIGHGQNIQKGGNISVWYGLTPDLELYQQFNKRLHRSGQTMPVWNHHIIAEGTHDETILPLLSQRDATQDRIIQATRVDLQRAVDR